MAPNHSTWVRFLRGLLDVPCSVRLADKSPVFQAGDHRFESGTEHCMTIRVAPVHQQRKLCPPKGQLPAGWIACAGKIVRSYGRVAQRKSAGFISRLRWFDSTLCYLE